MTIWILQKLRDFVWKRGSFALQKPFLLLITTKKGCWHITIGDRKRGKILGRMEISRPLHRKAKILRQLENVTWPTVAKGLLSSTISRQNRGLWTVYAESNRLAPRHGITRINCRYRKRPCISYILEEKWKAHLIHSFDYHRASVYSKITK